MKGQGIVARDVTVAGSAGRGIVRGPLDETDMGLRLFAGAFVTSMTGDAALAEMGIALDQGGVDDESLV
ncbi:MAG TPA: hypothetical protein VMV44_16325 [Rectinemataceae bacterium]|nr:hypothetical protein [Rectinemataceae bacterium]